jgi:hypothetical protein
MSDRLSVGFIVLLGFRHRSIPFATVLLVRNWCGPRPRRRRYLIWTTTLPGSPLFQIRKRLLRLFERKYLIDYRPGASRLEKLADLGELPTVRMHERDAT